MLDDRSLAPCSTLWRATAGPDVFHSIWPAASMLDLWPQSSCWLCRATEHIAALRNFDRYSARSAPLPRSARFGEVATIAQQHFEHVDHRNGNLRMGTTRARSETGCASTGDVPIAMDDGIALRCDVFRPDRGRSLPSAYGYGALRQVDAFHRSLQGSVGPAPH